MVELRDTRKAITNHFSFIQGKCSMSEAIEHIKQYGIGKKANNSVSESDFKVFKESISKFGRIRFDHA